MRILAGLLALLCGPDPEVERRTAERIVVHSHAMAAVTGVAIHVDAVGRPVGKIRSHKIVGLPDGVEGRVAGARQFIRTGNLRKVRRTDDWAIVVAVYATLGHCPGRRQPLIRSTRRWCRDIVAQP